MEHLSLALLFLFSALVIVPIFHKMGLGPVLGYLVAGILIGPSCFKLVYNAESVLQFSELGVIFLMFIIGLELQPSRLWVLRRSVFGLGFAQLSLTTALVLAVALAFHQSWKLGLILGFGLSMSSTALILQSLAERSQLTTQYGRDAFSILLFQDLAVIPILTFLPMMASGYDHGSFTWSSLLAPLGTVIGFVVFGRILLKRVFQWVASTGNRDLFTVAALLVVIGAAALMTEVGLTAGLGAFLSGVLLADSEFRHELEADIDPFKGLLLGLFFMAIGMSAQIRLLLVRPLLIISLVVALYVLKAAVLIAIKKVTKAPSTARRKLALYLSGGGEFAFVLFASAAAAGLMKTEEGDLWVIVVTLSMLVAPLLFVFDDKVLSRHLDQKKEPEYDRVIDHNPVIIAGFGRVGQIVGRLLHVRKIPFTALEKNSQHVDFVRRFGNKVFYGDASRLDLLNAAGVANAKLFVLAISQLEDSLKIIDLMQRHFPHVPVFARARNRAHVYKLMERGIKVIYRDTLLSSLEMSKEVLSFLGLPAEEAERTVEIFQKYDEDMLQKQYVVYRDEKKNTQLYQQAMADLEALFESDPSSPSS
jgi:glutathione-regulated potassium-efflux system ancillary protein KefC/glutathione-regulated potassium-efflux system protein KefB